MLVSEFVEEGVKEGLLGGQAALGAIAQHLREKVVELFA